MDCWMDWSWVENFKKYKWNKMVWVPVVDDKELDNKVWDSCEGRQ